MLPEDVPAQGLEEWSPLNVVSMVALGQGLEPGMKANSCVVDTGQRYRRSLYL